MREISLAAVVTLLPLAAASGTLTTPVASVELENGHTSDCLEDATGLCLATLRASTLADAEVNAEQRIDFVRLRVNTSLAEGTPFYSLLPDEGVTIRRETAELPNPVHPALARHVGYLALPAGGIVLFFNETGHSVEYVGPGLAPLDPDFAPRSRWYPYSTDGSVEYDTIGPSRDYGGAATDDVVTGTVGQTCEAQELSACAGMAAHISQVAQASTPNLIVGLEFHEIQAGGSGSSFGAAAEALRSPASSPPLGPRRSVEAPAHLDRSSPQTPVLRDGGSPATHIPEAASRPRATPDGATPQSATRAREPFAPRAGLPVLAAATFALALLLASLFSRFHREEALLHAKRRRIVALLESHGPMSYPDLGRAMGVDRTTIDFHVRLLVKTGFVTTAKGGRMTFVMLPGQEMALNFRRGDAEAAQALLQVLRENAGKMPRQALHDAASMFSQRTRNGALGRLIEHGLVERAFEGKLEVVRLARTPQRGSLRGQRLHGA